MCDGDVINLAGVRPFDRMMTDHRRAAAPLQGHVHRLGHQPQLLQHRVAAVRFERLHRPPAPVLARAGRDRLGPPARDRPPGAHQLLSRLGRPAPRAGAPAQLFNPLYPLPHALTRITRVERGYNASSDPSLALPLEDFTNPTGTGRSGLPTTSEQRHRRPRAAARSTPSPTAGHGSAGPCPGCETFFQTNLTAPGSGVSLSRFGTLDLRVDRAADPANPPEGTNFSVQLVNADGTPLRAGWRSAASSSCAARWAAR